MKNLIIIAIFMQFLLLVTELFGQQTTYKFIGKVVDESVNEPMTGVAILEPNSGKGVVTDERGEFMFEIKSLPIQLYFKYLGYFDDTLRIDNREQFRKYYEGTPLKITLRRNPFLLDEVVIRPFGSAIQMFREEPYAIMEYVISGDRFYALGYRNFNPLKPEVFVGNPSGRLLYSSPLPKGQEIFQDCVGEIYAVDHDSAFQLKKLADSLFMIPVCNVSFFETKVKPFVALKDPYYIHFDKSNNGQYHDYFLGNYETKQNVLFYRVGDEMHEQGFINIDKQIRQEFIGEFSKSYYGPGELREMHARQARLLNQINTDYRPVHSSLFQLMDSALLFDFNSQVVNCITISGELRWRSRILIDLNKDFTGRIHFDIETNRFFLEFLNIQSTYLIEIDPYTGKALANIPIRQYKHIDHISVNNNRVYFLFQPDFGDKGKKLYYINL